jgi:CBS-domain-containing membrane protein
MIKYEILPTVPLSKEAAVLRSQILPELVHLDDPAVAVLSDFNEAPPHTISPDDPIDHALNEMKVKGVHILLVLNKGQIEGLIGSEDILGEKPIKLIQHRRIQRNEVLVKMVMIPIEQTVAFDLETIQHARVGNIVNTMKQLQTHYALVIQTGEDKNTQIIRGLFSTSQISKQLHMEIANSITKAKTFSEFQKRKG